MIMIVLILLIDSNYTHIKTNYNIKYCMFGWVAPGFLK